MLMSLTGSNLRRRKRASMSRAKPEVKPVVSEPVSEVKVEVAKPEPKKNF